MMQDINDKIQYIILFITLAGSLFGLAGLIIFKAQQLMKYSRNILDIVNLINHEIYPNGGGSLRDMIIQNKLISRLYIENTNLAVMGFNQHHECIFANPKVCHVFKTSEEDMLGKGWLNFIEDGVNVWNHFEESVTAKIPHTMKCKLHDGTICKISTNVEYASNGKMISALGIINVEKRT